MASPYVTMDYDQIGTLMSNQGKINQGVADLYAEAGIDNPYSLINPADYRLNRRGKLQYQHDLAEAQTLAEAQLMMYQNKYNSPEAQAQRMRAAGQNPDLAGIQGEQAAGMSGAATPPDMAGIETNVQQTLGIVDTTLSLIAAFSSGAIGVASAAQGLQMNAANVAGKKLDNLSKVFGATKGIGDTIGSVVGLGQHSDGSAELALIEDYTRHAPRQYRQSLRKYLTDYMDTPQYLRGIYESRSAENKARGEYAKTSVDPRTGGELDDIMEALKPMQEAEFRIAKQMLKGNESKAEKMSAYWMNKDMGLQAETENAENRSQKGEAEIQEIVRSGALKSIGYLEKHMKDGKWWASSALAALYAALSGAGNLMPSLGFSSNSSQHTDPKTGQIVNNSSNAWNFGF